MIQVITVIAINQGSILWFFASCREVQLYMSDNMLGVNKHNYPFLARSGRRWLAIHNKRMRLFEDRLVANLNCWEKCTVSPLI
jgi:hypothetical protein